MRFEVYEDNSHEFRWRLIVDNGKIVADSGEGYIRREDAHRAALTLRRTVARSRVLDA